MSKDTRLQDKLRQCARDNNAGNPFWIDSARQLMLWAADALDAAEGALMEQYRRDVSANAKCGDQDEE